MAIKVGTHYVSEAAYAHAQKSVSELQSDKDMLSQLSKKFPDVHFSTNTRPFQANGTNNIAISPVILGQMKNDPDKRLEYEALIYDCNAIQKSFGNTSNIASQGFIIDAKGDLSSWCVTKGSGESSNKSLVPLPKDDKKSWFDKIIGDLKPTAFLPADKKEWRI